MIRKRGRYMSVSSVSGSTATYDFSTIQQQRQQFGQEFQQLGSDLQAGNLTSAQADFATLQQNAPSGSQGTGGASGTSSISSQFNQLSQDLQQGNVTAAQQDYTNLQQTLKSHRGGHHHHHHGGGDSGGTSSTDSTGGANGTSSPEQTFEQLGQDLQNGNTAAALQAYTSLPAALRSGGPVVNVRNVNARAAVYVVAISHNPSFHHVVKQPADGTDLFVVNRSVTFRLD